ncbi:MAG TPA: protein kinase [Terriglobales bacterium]
MTPERWLQVRDLLEKVLEVAPDQRSAYLLGACPADSSLRGEVEILLASSDRVRSSFLQTPPQPSLMPPGTRLGVYEIRCLLGAGGMGEVYRARDSRLGRDVAIKVLPASLSADPERLRRFEAEARAAAALNHPNILAVFEMDTHNGSPYLVAELLEGGTLREILRRGRLAVSKAIDYAVQVARGLAAAHEKGILHRDLKPDNLFVTNDGRVKILDFGLAKLTQPLPGSEHESPTVTNTTEVGVVMGTVGYMSPEQVRGQSADHRTDIFSFGAVLYEMLASKRAFQAATSADTMSAILNDDPPSLAQSSTVTSPALQRVVRRCLEKNPEQRFQSASDLAFALDALSDSATSVTPFREKNANNRGALAFVKTHKLWATLALVGASLLTAGLYSARDFRARRAVHAKLRHTQFTFSGDAYFPAISPDGLFVAYTKYNPPQNMELKVQSQSGAEVELAQGIVGNSRWSPDGSEILFVVFSKDNSPHNGDNSTGEPGVYVVSRLGGVARRIDTGQLACWLDPSGSQIITTGTQGIGTRGVRLVNRTSGEIKEIHQPEYTWLDDIDCSPRTGFVLIVVQAGGKYQILTFKPDGSEQRTLLEASDVIDAARWSSSGDSVYYLHGKGSTQELSNLSFADGRTEPTAVAEGLQAGAYFTLSSNASRLAYTRDIGASNLWRITLPAGEKAKTGISRLTSGTSYYGASSFSPDGQWSAFTLGPNGDETNLFKMPAGGGAAVQLTFFEHARIMSPTWSPDGARIAFISDRDHTPRIWIVGANGGAAKPIENSNASDTNNKLAWLPNGEIVYQQPGLRNFLQISEATNEQKPLIRNDQLGWVPSTPAFSPDGKKMAVFWNRKDMGLYLISLEPYSETLLLPGIYHPFGWSPDGKVVYAVRRNGSSGDREIISVKAATPSATNLLATLPGEVVESGGASVSPDGRQILVGIAEDKSDVWLMENFDPSLP